ncbi:MAG: hypothetical protein AAF919_06940 [Pseudomonadota bacterium]
MIKRASNIPLLILQWALVLWGTVVIAVSINTYLVEAAYFADIPAASPGEDSYTPPIFQRMGSGVASGLASVGVGAILFYLRRLYLRTSR